MPNSSQIALRVIQDEASDGPHNMAKDETLLNHVGQGNSPLTLRIYQWSSPTISLGYFQHFADYERLVEPAGRLPVVRRLTGGGAILHDLEVTYSIVLPSGHLLLRGGPNRLYELVHDAVIAVLFDLGVEAARCGISDDSGAARGPFFCFERRHCYDVIVERGKIAGSAQRRTRQAVLQHGSVILGSRFPQQPTAWKDEDANPAFQYSENVNKVRKIFAESFAKISGLSLNHSEWNPEEQDNAVELIAKYTSDQWNRRL